LRRWGKPDYDSYPAYSYRTYSYTCNCGRHHANNSYVWRKCNFGWKRDRDGAWRGMGRERESHNIGFQDQRWRGNRRFQQQHYRSVAGYDLSSPVLRN
jgi:hypothetical protein